MNLTKHLLVILMILGCSQSAFALTQEECQLKRDSLDTYILSAHAMIRKKFASRDRYRFAYQKTMLKNIEQAELEFYSQCPDYVYPESGL